jgi:ketosteroid isomerase-like protein
MRKQPLVMVLVLLIGAAFCGRREGPGVSPPSTTAVDADVAAIKASLAEYVDLYNAEDYEKLISVFYAPNAILMSPNAPARRTSEAILFSYQKYSELNIEHIDTSVAEDMRVCGDLAYAWGMDTGTTTPRSGGAPVPYSLKWLMVFERQFNGAWKCLYEMWNENSLAVDMNWVRAVSQTGGESEGRRTPDDAQQISPDRSCRTRDAWPSAARFLSLKSRILLRMRRDLGVTSSSSSSLM